MTQTTPPREMIAQACFKADGKYGSQVAWSLQPPDGRSKYYDYADATLDALDQRAWRAAMWVKYDSGPPTDLKYPGPNWREAIEPWILTSLQNLQTSPAPSNVQNMQIALDPRLTEWGYSSTDEAITHLGKLLDDQAAFDGLADSARSTSSVADSGSAPDDTQAGGEQAELARLWE